jgi:hypothetical protein
MSYKAARNQSNFLTYTATPNQGNFLFGTAYVPGGGSAPAGLLVEARWNVGAPSAFGFYGGIMDYGGPGGLPAFYATTGDGGQFMAAIPPRQRLSGTEYRSSKALGGAKSIRAEAHVPLYMHFNLEGSWIVNVDLNADRVACPNLDWGWCRDFSGRLFLRFGTRSSSPW